MRLFFSAIAESLALIGAANAAPVALNRLLSNRYSAPVDGGLVLCDGHRLLGRSKTLRGVGIGILVPASLSLLMGFSWRTGALVGVAAMAGDCMASFIKRRLGLAASTMALGLDQIPRVTSAGDFDAGVRSARRHGYFRGCASFLFRRARLVPRFVSLRSARTALLREQQRDDAT